MRYGKTAEKKRSEKGKKSPTGINNPKPKEPPIKIEMEATRDMAKTFNANLKDRSLKVYNTVANKIEQITKGNNN